MGCRGLCLAREGDKAYMYTEMSYYTNVSNHPWYVLVFLVMSFDVWLLTERHELSRNKLDYAMLESDAEMLTRNEVLDGAESRGEHVFIVVWRFHIM